MPRKQQSLADFLAIGISPALIMALVGSLVFFLLDILYRGAHQGNMRWVLFFFVFASVLVARISMEQGISKRAPMYAIVLGFAVWLALERYVEYPPDADVAGWAWAINLGLILLILWSTHRLTKDCTLIDDQVDASGAGLLDAAGLEKPPSPQEEPRPGRRKKKDKDPPGLEGWWARYWRYREEQTKKPQAPGVWVVYFSLAALPIFGLGQAQIPVEETERRAYAFWLMCLYVGSGLGLLLTTSFLGLRRYLRQRKLQMPVAVATAWITAGVLLIVTLMVLGAALPRPAAANPLWRWAGLGSEKHEGSAWGQVGRGKEAKDGTRRERDKKGPSDAKGNQKSGKPGEQSGSKSGGDKKLQDNQRDGSKAKEDSENDKGDNDKKGAGDDRESKAQNGVDKKKDGEKQKDGEATKNADSQDQKDPRQSGVSQKSASSSFDGFFSFLAKLLKWIVLIVVGAVIAFFVLRALVQFLANFTHWARDLLAWWNRLLAWWEKREQPTTAEELEEDESRPPRPFAAFHDPFLSGAADRMRGADLVRYSFEALEALAWERDFGREVGETPMEFARRVADEAPALEEEARRLAQLYAGLAYGRAGLSAQGRAALRRFWQMLTEVAVRPLSAGIAK